MLPMTVHPKVSGGGKGLRHNSRPRHREAQRMHCSFRTSASLIALNCQQNRPRDLFTFGSLPHSSARSRTQGDPQPQESGNLGSSRMHRRSNKQWEQIAIGEQQVGA